MNWRIWTMTITAAVVSCIVALVVLPDSPDREIARLNRQLEIELPLGTSRADVEKWLNDRPTFHDISGAADGARWTVVQAHREYFWYWSGWLMISFSFDDQDRLVKHHIEFEEIPL